MPTAEQLIKHFRLQPHPEGGFFREVYRAKGTIPRGALPDSIDGDRHYSTSIFYLLTQGKFSFLHRIRSDEAWHFYLGDPLVLAQISPNGEVNKTILGQNVLQGQQVHHVVPAGHWFGAYVQAGGDYSLVGCTVAPGFDFADFEEGKRAELWKLFPHAKELIENLTLP